MTKRKKSTRSGPSAAELLMGNAFADGVREAATRAMTASKAAPCPHSRMCLLGMAGELGRSIGDQALVALVEAEQREAAVQMAPPPPPIQFMRHLGQA